MQIQIRTATKKDDLDEKLQRAVRSACQQLGTDVSLSIELSDADVTTIAKSLSGPALAGTPGSRCFPLYSPFNRLLVFLYCPFLPMAAESSIMVSRIRAGITDASQLELSSAILNYQTGPLPEDWVEADVFSLIDICRHLCDAAGQVASLVPGPPV